MRHHTDMSKHGISVSCDNIIHWIEFKQFYHKRMICHYRINVPHNRRQPDTHLKHDTDNLCQITEENNNRTCCIDKRQHKTKSAERIVHQLQHIRRRKITVSAAQNQGKSNEKDMDKTG